MESCVTLRALVVDDEDLARERVRDLVVEHPALELVGEAADGAAALDLVLDLKPDVVFLDIQMPELTGFEVIAALAEVPLPAIVFVTAFDEFAVQAFEVGAFDYLLKPVTRERFAAAVERMAARIPGREEASLRGLAAEVLAARGYLTRFVARRSGRHYLVPVRDVLWLESERNYIAVHANGATHLVRNTMKQIEARLDPDRFVRVHRSAIVAIDRIAAVETREHGEYTITMQDGKQVVSSRGYSGRVRKLLR
jgi:two-component system LytT family response regulator